MPTFATIYDAYRQSQPQNLSLEDFSRLGNLATGSENFNEGINGWFGGGVKRGSYWLDRGLEATGLPQASAEMGRGFFDLVGANPEQGAEVGRSIPRGIVDFLPMLVAGVASGGTSLIPTAAGMLGAGALGAANAYEKSDSGRSAATAFAMPFVGGAAGELGALGVNKALGFTAQSLAKSLPQRVASYLGAQVAAMPAMEGLNVLGGGELPDVFDKNYWAGLVAQQIPFAVGDAHRLLKGGPIAENAGPENKKPLPEALPEIVQKPEVIEALADIENSRQAEKEEAIKASPPEELPKRLEEIDAEHDLMAKVFGPKAGEVPPSPERLAALEEKYADGPSTKVDEFAQDNEAAANAKMDEHIANLNQGFEGVKDLAKQIGKEQISVETPNAEIAPTIQPDLDKPWTTPLSDTARQALMKSGQIVEGPDGLLYRPLVEKPKTVELKTVAETATSLPEETRESVRVNVEKSVADGDSPNFAIEREVQKVENAVKERKPRKMGEASEEAQTFLWNLLDRKVKKEDPKDIELAKILNRPAESGRILNRDVEFFSDVFSALDFGKYKGKFQLNDFRQSYLSKPARILNEYVKAWKEGRSVGKSPKDPATLTAEEVLKLAKESAKSWMQSEAGILDGLTTAAKERLKMHVDNDKVREAALEEGYDPEDVDIILKGSGGQALSLAGKFEFRLQKVFDQAKKSFEAGKGGSVFGSVLDKNGALPTQTLLAKLSKSGATSPEVMQLMEIAKLLEKNGKVSVVELAEAARQASTAEVHVYGQEGTNAELAKIHAAQHELETRRIQVAEDYGELSITRDGEEVDFSELSPQEQEWASIVGAPQTKEGRNYNGPRATDHYNQISPFDTKQYPVVRVDVVLPHAADLGPTEAARMQELGRRYRTLSAVERQEYENLADRRAVAAKPLWMADNLHENLPNTLGWAMVQFVPENGPSQPLEAYGFQKQGNNYVIQQGNAYARVIDKGNELHILDLALLPKHQRKGEGGALLEKIKKSAGERYITLVPSAKDVTQQSRLEAFYESHGFIRDGNEYFWKPEMVAFVGEHQSRWGQDRAKAEKTEKSGGTRPGIKFKADDAVANHPLLDFQNSLVLKAVIEEAKKRGVKKVVVSDGETAMMTEGHDTNVIHIVEYPNLLTGEFDGTRAHYYSDAVSAEQAARNNNGRYRGPVVSQDAGMRLHYDTTLPGVMKKLTGKEGEKVEMGVHKNAFSRDKYAIDPDAASPEELLADGSITQEEYQQAKADQEKGLVGSPVFRNPNGTPKTNITGRAYDISQLSENMLRLASGDRLAGTTQALPEMFKSVFESVARKSGLTADETETLWPKFEKFSQKLALGDTGIGELINDTADLQIRGAATVSGKLKSLWLSAQKGTDPELTAKNLAAVLAHEAGHTIEHLYNQGKLTGVAKEAYDRLLAWREKTSLSELQKTLRHAAETLLPAEWQKSEALLEMLNTSDGEEAHATLQGIFSLSNFIKESGDISLSAASMPEPVRTFWKATTDFAKRVLEVFREMLHGMGLKTQASQTEYLLRNLKKVQQGINEANKALVEARSFLTEVPTSHPVVYTSMFEVLSEPGVYPKSELERFSVFGKPTEEHAELLNEPKTILGKGLRGMSRWFEYGDQLAKAWPIFKQVQAAIARTPDQAKFFLQEHLMPLYGSRDPETGRISPASPEHARHIELWEKDLQTNKLINEIRHDENLRKSLFDPNNPGKWEARLKELPEDKRNAVVSYVLRDRKRVEAEHNSALPVLRNHFAGVIAKSLVARNPGLFEHGQDLGRLAMEAALARQEGDLNLHRALMEKAAELTGPEQLAEISHIAEASARSYAEIHDFFTSRPWFNSYMRMGEFVVHSFDAKTGKQEAHAYPAANAAEAQNIARQFQAQGKKTKIEPINKGKRFTLNEELEATLKSADERLMRVLQERLADRMGPEEVQAMMNGVSLAGALYQVTESTLKIGPTESERNLKGAEGIDIVSSTQKQAAVFANYLAKILGNTELSYQKLNPKFNTSAHKERLAQLEEIWRNYQTPDNPTASAITKAGSMWSLAMNVPNSLAETYQPFSSILSGAVAEHGFKVSARELAKVLKDVLGHYGDRAMAKISGTKEFELWKEPDEKRMLEALRGWGKLNAQVHIDALDSTDQSTLTLAMRARGSKLSFLTSPLKTMSDWSMRWYESLNRHNSRIAALLSYRLNRAKGMEHAEATLQAARDTEAWSFVNTRALRPAASFAPDVRIAGQFALMMQRFSLSTISMFARNIQKSFFLSDAEMIARGMDPTIDRKHARQALLTQTMSQFVAAGALGLPMAGAMSKLFQELTGEDLKADVYSSIGEFFGNDTATGGFIADGLLRGFLNSGLNAAGVPLDLSSRFAIGGLPGMSEMQGFDGGSAFGPFGGLIKTAFTGVEQAAKDGDFIAATKTIMPAGLKKAFDVLANGDMTDAKGASMGLTPTEKAAYALGFIPPRIRKLRDYDSMMENVTRLRRKQQDQSEEKILEVLAQNTAGGRALLEKEAKRLGISQKDLANGVADNAVKRTFPKDFRADIPALDARQSLNLLRGMAIDFQPSLETKKAQFRGDLLSSLGIAPNPTSVASAMRADQNLALNPFQPLSAARGSRSSFAW